MKLSRQVSAVLLCAAFAVLGGCGVRPQLEQAAAGDAPAPSPAANHAYDAPTQNLEDAISAAVHDVAPGSTLGAIVFDRYRDTELLTVNSDRQFRSASVVKLLIAIAELRGPAGDTERVTEMLVYSNNQIASTLWVENGWDQLVTRLSDVIGLRDTEPPADRGMWGNTLLSARDVVRIYRFIMTDLPENIREVIVQALASTAEHATDGWYQYFGIPDGIGRPWAVKQGWSNSGAKLVVHTTGLVGRYYRYVVVVLLEAEPSTSWNTMRDAATAAAHTVAPIVGAP